VKLNLSHCTTADKRAQKIPPLSTATRQTRDYHIWALFEATGRRPSGGFLGGLGDCQESLACRMGGSDQKHRLLACFFFLLLL